MPKVKHYAKGMTQAEYMVWYRAQKKKLEPIIQRLPKADRRAVREMFTAILEKVRDKKMPPVDAAKLLMKIIESELARFLNTKTFVWHKPVKKGKNYVAVISVTTKKKSP